MGAAIEIGHIIVCGPPIQGDPPLWAFRRSGGQDDDGWNRPEI
jgi:hypothetical protein